MKKIWVFLLFLLAFSGCGCTAAGDFGQVDQETSAVEVVEAPSPIWPEIEDSMVLACATAINRIEADRVEVSLPVCVGRFRNFYADTDSGAWPTSGDIYYIAFDVVKIWTAEGIRTYADAYGCSGGCKINFRQFPADRVVKVLQEEIKNQGEELREKGYSIPIFE